MAVSQAIGRAHIIAVHAEIELHRLVIAQIAHLNRFCGVNDRNSRLFSRSALGVGQPFCAPLRMMGWTAPRTASACQDGRCQNPI
jgi:hypothetical protein